MAPAISYSVGYTAIGAAGTTVTVAPPPVYAAGDLLVMGVIAGGTSSTVVSASTPSGWTRLSSSGAGLGVFTKTATGSEPASYTLTLSGTSCAAAFTAAYPAATVVSSAFQASASDVVTCTPAFPSGVTSGETVLLVAGAVASPADVNSNSGYQNVSLPSGSGWATEVPVFGPALPDNASSVSPVAVGLADVTGSTTAQAMTSPQGCTLYAGYVVLNVTGTAPAAPYSVTATGGGAAAVGLALTVKALSGAAPAADTYGGGAFANFYASGVSQAPQAALTPAASGSQVYGAVTENFGVTGGTSYTAASGTTFSQNVPDALSDCIYGTFRSTAATTAGTPVTLGGSAPASAYATAALAEVLAAPGASLAETATATAGTLTAGAFATTSLALTASFASPPAPGTLLVAMVSANSYYGNGNATFTLTDSGGLTWYPLAEVHYPSYSGVWIAGTAAARTATAALTVTPSRAAARARGRYRAASATVTPVRSAAPSGARYTATASLTVTPAPAAAASGGAPPHAVLDEAGAPVLDEAGAVVLDESGAAARTAAAPLAAAPSLLAARAHGHSRTAAAAAATRGLAVPAGVNYGTAAALALAPALAAAAAGGSGTPAAAVLDEAGAPVLDEAGAYVLDESTPGAVRASAALAVAVTATATGEVPATAGPWSAARAGLPGDSSATNWASQASQFLTTHGITAVYAGTLIWTPAAVSAGVTNAFSWLAAASPGWLPAADVSQPFQAAAGVSSAGRVQVPVLASGNGAGLQVLLCADNGSGAPLTASPLASALIPASHVLATSAAGSLAVAGPLAVASHNTSLLGAYSTGPWTQPAVSANGAGSYATPATSGNFTALIGGFDSTARAASGYTAVVTYQGTSMSGGMTQPALPQPAYYTCATITADSVVAAGGNTGSAGTAAVWTAPWTPGSGSIGAWSAQQALPAAVVYGAMASWGSQVYVIGGSPNGAAASATSAVWTAASQSGQVTAWTAAPPLPQKVSQAYAAVIGNWLVVAGGQSTAGTAVAYTWYSAINPDGSLAGWQQGPSLPQPVLSFAPGWNLAVTDSAMVIVAGVGSGFTQVLPVSPDGPSGAWQAQQWGGSTYGEFQCGAYPAGPSGEWQVAALHVSTADLAALSPVALVSVPLPATGLTPGHTYHVVMRQLGGSVNDSLTLGVMASSGTGWLSAPRGTDSAWTPTSGSQVAVNVFDGSATGNVMHLVQDSGAGLVTLVRSGGNGLLAGIMESAAFPTESPEATLGTVSQVTWSGGLPSGLVNLA